MLNKISLAIALFWTLLIPLLCFINTNEIPQVEINNIDKLVHFTFYFIFSGLWFIYFYTKSVPLNLTKISGYILLVSVLYGGSIELLQGAFTVSRVADINDAIANSLGALFAHSIIRICIKNKVTL